MSVGRVVKATQISNFSDTKPNWYQTTQMWNPSDTGLANLRDPSPPLFFTGSSRNTWPIYHFPAPLPRRSLSPHVLLAGRRAGQPKAWRPGDTFLSPQYPLQSWDEHQLSLAPLAIGNRTAAPPPSIRWLPSPLNAPCNKIGNKTASSVSSPPPS